MFLLRRPSPLTIDRFLRDSQQLPLSYSPTGVVDDKTGRFRLDEERAVIGRGKDDFERARSALMTWTQFDTGWVETFQREASVEPGSVVAVLIGHLGFWSLNGCRVLYHVGGRHDEGRFGFAYGTLTNHAECGEELFEVFVDPATSEVIYRLRAASRPRAALARAGHPVVRLLQARFRRDSAAAMKRAVCASAR